MICKCINNVNEIKGIHISKKHVNDTYEMCDIMHDIKTENV